MTNLILRAKTEVAVGLFIALVLLSTPLAVYGGGDRAIPRFALVLDSGAVFVKEAGFGSGFRYGGGAFFKTGHRMGLEIMLERFAVPVAPGAADLPSAGRMTMTTLLVNEQLFVLTEGRILPYALLGIGFSFPGYAPDARPSGAIRRVFVDRMALQMGAGVDVRISPALAVCGKARYNLVKTWMEDEGRTDPIRDTDPLAQNMLYLYGLELAVGVKIGF